MSKRGRRIGSRRKREPKLSQTTETKNVATLDPPTATARQTSCGDCPNIEYMNGYPTTRDIRQKGRTSGQTEQEIWWCWRLERFVPRSIDFLFTWRSQIDGFACYVVVGQRY